MTQRSLRLALLLSALAAPAGAECPLLPITDLVTQSIALSPATDDARLLELILRDADREPEQMATPPEAIVVTEQILRGGSDSAMRIEVYPGQEDGLCATPISIDLSVDLNQPYRIDTFPTDLPGQPGLDIRYRFWGDNAFGAYQTTAAYVTDERVERYLPKDGTNVLESREILDCILCAPETKPQ